MTNPDQFADLSDPLLRSMGLVTWLWGNLEIQMEFCILQHQEIDLSTGLTLTTNLSYRAKADLLIMFAKEKSFDPDDENDALKKIMSRADKLYGERNKVAHASWTRTDDPLVAQVRTVRTRGRLIVMDEPVSVSDLLETAKKIRLLGADMLKFMERNNLLPQDSN